MSEQYVYVVTRVPEVCFDDGSEHEIIGATGTVEEAQNLAKEYAVKFDSELGIEFVVMPNMVEVFLGDNMKDKDDTDKENYYYYRIDKVKFVGKIEV